MKTAIWMATALLLSFTWAGPANAAPEVKSKKSHCASMVQGKITAVDAEKGSVTIEKGRGDKKQTLTFSIPKTSRIKVNKKPGKLSVVKVGMRAYISFEKDGRTVKSFSAIEPKSRAKKGKDKDEDMESGGAHRHH